MKLTLKIILAFFLLSLLFNTTFITTSVESRNYLLKTESSITIVTDTTDFGIVSPDGSEVSTNIAIIYEYGWFARPEGSPFPKKRMPTTINLTIDSMPDWCSVELDQGRFEASVDTFLFAKTRTINLSAKSHS